MVRFEKTPIEFIKPNKYNPNKMSDHKFKALVRNIKSEGEMLQPILVDKDFIIIDGEHRWKASKKAGLKEIYTVITESQEEESKLKTIAFNQIRGEYDIEKFTQLLEDIVGDIDYESIAKETSLFISDIKTMLGDYENEIAKIDFTENLKVEESDETINFLGLSEKEDTSDGFLQIGKKEEDDFIVPASEEEKRSEMFEILKEQEETAQIPEAFDDPIDMVIKCSVSEISLINQALNKLRRKPEYKGLDNGKVLYKYFSSVIDDL